MFIGARAGSTTTEHWQMPSRKVTIVHLDVDAMTIGTNYRTDVALVGDALLGLQALHAAVQQRIARRPADAADGASLAATARAAKQAFFAPLAARSEEHTSELQSQSNLVCRLLLEKKKNAARTGQLG